MSKYLIIVLACNSKSPTICESLLATTTKIFSYDDNRIFVHCVSVQL